MAHPNSIAFKQRLIDDDPFRDMKISDSGFLHDLKGRQPCPRCCKSRKYFCYTCYIPIAELEGKLPTVKLPLQIDIIKHKREIDGKSTSAHVALLASEDVRIYTYPDIPDYANEKVVLIFPSYDAVSVEELFQVDCTSKQQPVLIKGQNRTTLRYNRRKTDNTKFTECSSCPLPIEKAVFIDSTWNQSKGIFKDPRINSLKCVLLQNRISQFWRHQKGSPRWYLSTVEAVHQFVLEIHLNMWGLSCNYLGLRSCFVELDFARNSNDNSYDGQYDDLLFFFKHMYNLIHEYYDHETLYAYKRPLAN